MQNPVAGLVRHTVAETKFGFFSAEEIRALSVRQITSSVTFDSLNHPVPGGLYDAALGPTDKDVVCSTCNQLSEHCPGHLGHIELAVPVYNPLLFAQLYKILRAKCLLCHRFRMATDRVATVVCKLQLAERGALKRAATLDEALLSGRGAGGAKASEEAKADAASRRRAVMDRARRFVESHVPLRQPGPRVRAMRRQLLAAFLSDAPNKCENCGAPSPALRKDGFTKIFQKPYSAKARQALRALNKRLEPALGSGGGGSGDGAGADEAKGGDDSDSDSDADAGEPGADGEADETDEQRQKFMPPPEVMKQMELLWARERAVLDLLLGDSGRLGHRVLFMQTLPVPPSRFRPPSVMAGMTFEHPQNVYLQQILSLNERLTNADEPQELAQSMNTWIELQHMVNCLMDAQKDKSAKEMPPGIRQVLERKEGLFRKHMMGKRVNYAARSVLSPDPYIGTDEIGVPLRFAKQLTYPEPVTPWNVAQLRQQVINGPDVHPGANYVADENGRKMDLSRASAEQREALARTLLTRTGASAGRRAKRVYRHLHTGDVLLVNRQPTLHKPGIMAHKVRVMSSPANQTIRMHYANCNTYNADFDGDEINLHFPQSELARAEAYNIAANDLQYIVPTDGKPIRGLIQDHVDAGVKLTKRDTFLTRDEYFQLLFAACNSMDGIDVVKGALQPEPPAILKPRKLWTGKQVVTSLLRQLCRGLPPLSLDGKTRTPNTAFGKESLEHLVVFREGELLRGVLDKGQFGSSAYGFVHAVHELYGPHMAGRLLTSLGRLFTCYLQFAGHTCGIQDLVLTPAAEAERRQLVGAARVQAEQALVEFLKLDGSIAGPLTAPLAGADAELVRSTLAALLRGNAGKQSHAALDGHLQSALAPAHSDIIKACLPGGQRVPFPKNNFSLMVLTGAKGGMVNHSQISCGLGQQALEGRRVPVMVSGKTLPCFAAFDPDPRASGYIADRFLTGIRPGEYYFHCMAGREGLVDTAVKTSRSGYLQRCLVKHLEDLTVGYDYSVRDGEGTVVQFTYGGDAIDPVARSYLSGNDPQMAFIARNKHALAHKYRLHADFFAATGLESRSAQAAHKATRRANAGTGALKPGARVMARRLLPDKLRSPWQVGNIAGGWHEATVAAVSASDGSLTLRYAADGLEQPGVPRTIEVGAAGSVPLCKPADAGPALHRLNIAKDVGAVSERLQAAIESYVDRNPDGLIAAEEKKKNKKDKAKKKSKKQASETKEKPGVETMPANSFELLLWVMNMRSLVNPGEAVGTVAAQSVGEPSTQMTLNTFHLAGHGGANVTLGIPRLREIIMTASQHMKTPSMTIPFLPGVDRAAADMLARRLSRLPVAELVHHERGIHVTEELSRAASGAWERIYRVRLHFHDPAVVRRVFGVSFKNVGAAVANKFCPHLLRAIKREMTQAGKSITEQQAGRGGSAGAEEGADVGSDSDAEDVPRPPSAAAAAAGKKSKKASKKAAKPKQATADSSDDEDPDSDVDAEEQGSLRFSRREEMAGYGEDDDEDRELRARDVQSSDDDEESGSEKEDEPPLDVEMELASPQRKSKAGAGKKKSKVELPDVVANNPWFRSLDVSKEHAWAEVTLAFDAGERKLLMVSLAEIAAGAAVVRHAPGIGDAFVVDDKEKGLCLQTAGVNFAHIWDMQDWLDVDKLASNDIYNVMKTYGIEAATHCIHEQITSVFGVYGIGVDPRHLQLLADYMTQSGEYRPLNRAGIDDKSSPMQQMSFETSMHFITQAAVETAADRMTSPSSYLVLGQPVKAGTGAFDLRAPLSV